MNALNQDHHPVIAVLLLVGTSLSMRMMKTNGMSLARLIEDPEEQPDRG